MLSTIFTNPDLFTSLTTFLNIDDIIELSRCCWTLNQQHKTPKYLQILLSTYNISKPVANFYDLIQEYYHRYDRTKSHENSEDFHLLWSVKDRDIKTCKEILSVFTFTRQRHGSHEFYQLYFEAGRHNDLAMFETLLNGGIHDTEIDQQTGFYAGMIYTRQIFEVPGQNLMKQQDLALLLFEAIRGGNWRAAQSIKLISKKFTKYVWLFGAVATNNCFLILKILNESIDILEFWKYEIPIYDSDVLSVHDGTAKTKLILYALHFHSFEAIELIESLVKINYASMYFPHLSPESVKIYKFLSTKYSIPPEENLTILHNASCYNNLELSKFLCDLQKLPECFGEMIDCNAYKVVSWMLQTFEYTKEEILAFKFSDTPNYSERLVLDVQERYNVQVVSLQYTSNVIIMYK